MLPNSDSLFDKEHRLVGIKPAKKMIESRLGRFIVCFCATG